MAGRDGRWTELDALREEMAAAAADLPEGQPVQSSALLGYAARLGSILAFGPADHSVQRDVANFHEALGLAVGETPAIRGISADLILEEARETAEAITGKRVRIEILDETGERPLSLAGAIDGLCDLLAVVYGAAVTFGIDLAPFWAEVHRTNMAKADGPKRQDGKQLKPPGWTPPDIAGLLGRLYPEATT